MPQVAGLVLAAGAGRRMGRPKALLDTPGGAAAQETVNRLHEAGCAQVVLVVGARADDVQATLTPRPWLEVVVAKGWRDGLSQSLRTGLTALEGTGVTAALITLVDLPDVGTTVYRRVIESVEPVPDALARATYAGIPGHPVLLGRAWWSRARTASGDEGARSVLASHRHTLIECSDLATGRDIDDATAAVENPW